jgi:hypothetical protein
MEEDGKFPKKTVIHLNIGDIEQYLLSDTAHTLSSKISSMNVYLPPPKTNPNVKLRSNMGEGQ